ncbi:MAG: hypothetical protein WKF88_09455 [Ferruginibacter sp.]
MKKLLSAALGVLLFVSCKKESEDFKTLQISDYAPLTIGKFVTYNLDSLVYTNFGTTESHRIYEVKYLVADSLRDALGRKAFRITRYIRSLPAGIFTPDNTFLAVNTGTGLEFTENNLRFLKLVQPIENGKTWKGNSAIDVSSLGSDVQYLFDWDYTYAEVEQPMRIGTKDLPNTITINQRDESFNLPVVLPGPGVANPTNIATRDYSQEVYAKDIGLVYKKFHHFEYQLAFNGYIGYGITLTMVDHN